MSKNQFIFVFLTILSVIILGVVIYLWMCNPLNKEYDWYAKFISFICTSFLISFINIITSFEEEHAKKAFEKNNAITKRIYQLIVLLFFIVYYLFISSSNALVLGISLFIAVLISGVCFFIYAKKNNNKNRILQ